MYFGDVIVRTSFSGSELDDCSFFYFKFIVIQHLKMLIILKKKSINNRKTKTETQNVIYGIRIIRIVLCDVKAIHFDFYFRINSGKQSLFLGPHSYVGNGRLSQGKRIIPFPIRR